MWSTHENGELNRSGWEYDRYSGRSNVRQKSWLEFRITNRHNQNRVVNTYYDRAAGSTAWSVLGLRMVKGDLNPGFYVEHYIKDLEIALEGDHQSILRIEAKRANLCLPGLALVK